MISITYMGGSDASLVDGVHYTVANATKTESGWINGSSEKPTITGNTTQISGKPKDEKNHVVVSAYFADGSSQVILDTHV